MGEPHVIRLRGPWKLESPAGDAAGGKSHVRCTRHFNRPTNLDTAHKVWLVFEQLSAPASITLNDQRFDLPSPSASPTRLDVTAALLPHNRLAVEFAGKGSGSGGTDNSLSVLRQQQEASAEVAPSPNQANPPVPSAPRQPIVGATHETRQNRHSDLALQLVGEVRLEIEIA